MRPEDGSRAQHAVTATERTDQSFPGDGFGPGAGRLEQCRLLDEPSGRLRLGAGAAAAGGDGAQGQEARASENRTAGRCFPASSDGDHKAPGDRIATLPAVAAFYD